jgi:hypothetical protein
MGLPRQPEPSQWDRPCENADQGDDRESDDYDTEPSLGWTLTGALCNVGEQTVDCEQDDADDEQDCDQELEDEHGGDILDMPHDDSIGVGGQDDEPSLGSLNSTAEADGDQRLWAKSDCSDHEASADDFGQKPAWGPLAGTNAVQAARQEAKAMLRQTPGAGRMLRPHERYFVMLGDRSVPVVAIV